LIEKAYRFGEKMGLAVWCQDEAGPFQTMPYEGSSWQIEEHPQKQSHEYIRNGTAKLLTLFHPADGQVRVKGVTSVTNAVLHPWLKQELSEIVKAFSPLSSSLSPDQNRQVWESWREGLTYKFTLPSQLPPLRMLLVWDNLAGHQTPELLLWLCAQGILPLFTPIAGSWLNMAESMQRILTRRALNGQHPNTPGQIIEWLETSAEVWNQHPTPFEWGGKRFARRQRARLRLQQHRLSSSGACTRLPLPRTALK
jgi:hypothetical protein